MRREDNIENFPGQENPEIKEKIPSDSSYETLEQKILEVRAMKGIDQRSDFHDLTLDEHTKEMCRHLEGDEFLSTIPEGAKNLVVLAGKLHDLGKASPEGCQIHPKDPEKRQYIGHEKVSEKLIREILPEHMDLSEEEIDFVAKLVGMHASALNLVSNFERNNQPKGRELGAYDDFLKKAEEIPGGLELADKMRIVFAMNRADKQAGYSKQSDKNSEKVKKIIEKAEKQIKALNEMEKALPAMIEAIRAKRGADQNAGIILENNEYKYKKGK